MLAFHDRVSIEDALQSSLDCRLRVLIADCIKQDIRPVTYDLIDYTSIVIARPGDTERTIRRELGFSPLVNVFDGTRFGTAEFIPLWDVLHDHGGWFELIFTVGNDGFAFVLFVQDAIGVDSDLLALCRTYARTTIHLI
jgi:hypothetical protein